MPANCAAKNATTPAGQSNTGELSKNDSRRAGCQTEAPALLVARWG